MQPDETRWTLEEWIDFEQEIAAHSDVSPVHATAVISASRGLEGKRARRRGLKIWLNLVRKNAAGRRFIHSLGIIGAVASLIFFVSGFSAVTGLLHSSEKRGINVSLFLALLLGSQWLILGISCLAWLFRRQATESFSTFQALMGLLARRLSGKNSQSWWQGLMENGSVARQAILWRIARHAQSVGIFFNLGILSGLAGLVLVRHIGFYWETTTDAAMHHLMAKFVQVLSFPWSAWWPDGVPTTEMISETRWLPGRSEALAPGPAAWWKFLLAAVIFWGLLPRLLLRFMTISAERKALAALDFQARHHRILWRNLTGSHRAETEEPPRDGVLVLEIGGMDLSPEILRPYFLRHLRANPREWRKVAVLSADPSQITEALRKAPAGVVLIAEGWALSPPRMSKLHSEIRQLTGKDTFIKFLVLNLRSDGSIAAPTDTESKEWERFTDSLRDPMAEVHFYQEAE